MTKKAVFIIAKPGYDTSGDTINMVIDSRRLTFKYLDRSGYQNGVYQVTLSGTTSYAPLKSIPIPHGLNYAPSVRIYAAGNLEVPATGVLSTQRIIVEPTWLASSPCIIATSDTKNVYLDIVRPSVASGGTFDILLLIGADNLDSEPTEKVYL